MNLVCVLFPATRDAVLRGRVQEEGEPPPAWSAEEKLEKYCKFTFWGYKLCQHGYANKSWLNIRGGLSPPPPPPPPHCQIRGEGLESLLPPLFLSCWGGTTLWQNKTYTIVMPVFRAGLTYSRETRDIVYLKISQYLPFVLKSLY